MSAVVPAKRLVELDRRDLRFHRYDVVEHVPSGRRYSFLRTQVSDPRFSPTRAFYRDENGQCVYLERPVRSVLIDEVDE
jgi:hypothetical protein